MTRRGVLAAAAFALAAFGLWQATPPQPSVTERAEAVAATLRCPTCQGLSVADSPSTVATSMRDIIDEQARAGRSDAQIRQWFVDRYGAWILLSPPADRLGWMVWTLPIAAVGAGGVLALRRTRKLVSHGQVLDLVAADAAARAFGAGQLALPAGRASERLESSVALLDDVRADRKAGIVDDRAETRALEHVAAALALVNPIAPVHPGPKPEKPRALRQRQLAWRWAALVTGFALALVALLAANTARRGPGEVITGDLPVPEPTTAVEDDALEQAQAAVDAAPEDGAARLALASLLLQRGSAGDAALQARQVLADEPTDPDALLLLALSQVMLDDDADVTLRRFLDAAPVEHPGRELAESILAGE